MPGAVRLTLGAAGGGADPDDLLFEALAGIVSSWSRDASGRLRVWVGEPDAEAARAALEAAGIRVEDVVPEEERDWVAASAALRLPVAVGRYLLDPHDGERASDPGSRRRVYLPAAQAFGTGSHESTRLALRLLLGEPLGGARVLDVGCGTGTLAFVAALEGAAWTVAFDLDADAAFATRELARENAVPRLSCFAGPLDALAPEPPFDVVVANMLHEEVAPLLPGLRRRLAPGGRLVTSGQLLAREAEWLALLRAEGFRPVRLAAESEWLGAVSVRT